MFVKELIVNRKRTFGSFDVGQSFGLNQAFLSLLAFAFQKSFNFFFFEKIFQSKFLERRQTFKVKNWLQEKNCEKNE